MFDKHKQNPGYRKLTHYINRTYKTNFNHKKIYRIMKKLGLKSTIKVRKRKFEKKTLKSKRKYLINRNFLANNSMKKLFTDVTYIKTNNHKNIYLSAIIDGFNNEIVAYKLDKRNDKNLIIIPLNHIIKKISKENTIINTDHGSIYFSNDYEKLASKYFNMSTSRIGNCLDNRAIEYFFSIIKEERIRKIPFFEKSFERLESEIKKFIKYYNFSRIQAVLNYKTPKEILSNLSNVL